MVKNPTANAGDRRDASSVPALGISPGERNGNPLQYSCLENPKDGGAWWAIVLGFANNRTQLKQLSTHTPTENKLLVLDVIFNLYLFTCITFSLGFLELEEDIQTDLGFRLQ